MRPKWDAASATPRANCVSSEMSTCQKRVAALSAPATRSPLAASMSNSATRTPLSRSAWTTPAPISVAPPVTMATLFCRPFIASPPHC
ncbi:hypothetical protein G6F40_018027 [Rhizopus arrhizus]|nr:hypothetical protein G6F40_018027 [Rhizopus arrhizus]